MGDSTRRIYVLSQHSEGYRQYILGRIQKVDPSISPRDKDYLNIRHEVTLLSRRLGEFSKPTDATIETGIRLGRVSCQDDLRRAQEEDRIQAMSPIARELMRSNSDALTPESAEEAALHSYVYYARVGEHVKIGTTTRLKERLRELGAVELLAAEPGAYVRERQLHRQFRHFRVLGTQEYYRPVPLILKQADKMRTLYGDPAM